jgi:1,4-alpha-glucan branching enzyme
MTGKQNLSAGFLKIQLKKLCDAHQHDPFSVLGQCTEDYKPIIRVFIPFCKTVQLGKDGPSMTRVEGTDLFEYSGDLQDIPKHYQLYWQHDDGRYLTEFDPYTFDPSLPDYDVHLFSQGKHWHVYRMLGAHLYEIDNIKGVRFVTWAPNAQRVSVLCEQNGWDGRRHPMQSIGGSGLWSLFIPGMPIDSLYKFEISNCHTSEVLVKTDPYAQAFELRPNTASLVTESDYEWQDEQWIKAREEEDWLHKPLSVYEVHIGSWRRDKENAFIDYRSLAEQLVDYVKSLGFTHIELLPICEHPFDDSWGYQSLGYFAPTSRYGSPDDFRYFVDCFHQQGIGVILDWVPAHFPKDSHGLARFDGTALYEHEDPRLGEHPDWGTLIFNYGRNEVKNFLLSSAVYWLEEFHIDGLRVDAVASLLYLDYSRNDNDWIPNKYGGNENLEAISFLRELNSVTHTQYPGTLVIAEESTAWPQVTRPASHGGLGFSMKWNMGWMHDTLLYMSKEPVHRKYHHETLTFGLLYSFHENFVLPFSHDEVVHGKGSLLNKMPGDEWQRFANLRLLYIYMFTYPGKKLLFMGCEFGQGEEWNHHQALSWYVLDYKNHQGIQKIIRDLNSLYVSTTELYYHDFEQEGFQWIDCDNGEHSVVAYMRKTLDKTTIVILNFTPVVRHFYRIGVPLPGKYHEVLNSDSDVYGGSNLVNEAEIHSQAIPWNGFEQSVTISLPPLAGIVLHAK